MRPRSPYRVLVSRYGPQLHYPPIRITREALEQLQINNDELPPRSSIPWRVERGPVTLIGFWVSGERSPHWYEAEIV